MADFAKKLTVSFGAFSCTLSGFDDPFPVMRQVVDYFQQLSKTDPSFGAHPERPNTEELRQIAEKTSGLSVGAEMNGDEVILRSTEEEDVAVEDVACADTTVDALEKADLAELTAELAVPQLPEDEEVAEKTSTQVEDTTASEKDPGVEPNFFEQIDITDFDDEVFDNIDADDIYAKAEDATDVPELSEQPKVNETYAASGVQFEDVDTSNEDLPTQDSAPATLEMNDTLEVWEAEFDVEETPETLEVPSELDAAPYVEDDDYNLPYEEHVAAEQKALERILATTQSSPRLASENPLTLRKVEATNSAPEPRSQYLPQEPNVAAESMTLGFGDEDSLDATREIGSDTLDARAKPDAAAAMAAMGVLGEESDEDFDWGKDAKATQLPASEAPSEPSVTPLLLTPSDQVSQPISQVGPSSTINLDQDDPRDDLRSFAKVAGAASLTELLDASAAYSTLVNGRPSFSRGEVLDLLDQFSEDDGFSQEARIKTFGSLLRGGRIQPVENGKYEMTNDALSEYQAKRTG